jgi:phosphatidylinositol alpha-mannosyltransferase
VAVSEQALATARRALGGDYELLWNGIDVGGYERAQPWPSAVPAICFIGRHEPRKGLAILIEAFARMGPDAKLWVIGEGPDTASLRQATLGDPRVEWLGVIGEEEKLRRLKGAKVFCAPSLYGESFGVVLLEAMAAGTPVVASDLPGYRHVAGAGATLVPPGDPVALARALSVALAGGPDIDAQIERGRARARHFSLSMLAQRYLELYARAGAR